MLVVNIQIINKYSLLKRMPNVHRSHPWLYSSKSIVDMVLIDMKIISRQRLDRHVRCSYLSIYSNTSIDLSLSLSLSRYLKNGIVSDTCLFVDCLSSVNLLYPSTVIEAAWHARTQMAFALANQFFGCFITMRSW
jgi:hypothetical protein